VLAALGPGGAELPCARVARADELVRDPQLLARGMLERHAHPTLGQIVFHGNPLRFAGAEPRRLALAPELGAHNAELYAELGLGERELAELAAQRVI
jgi:crotonobetainyl-CoA:carnitine CoA-transferase CaiB-like acyl-CoA transferase